MVTPETVPVRAWILAVALLTGACAGGGGRAPTQTGSGGDGGPDAGAVDGLPVADVPGPFTAWTICTQLTSDRPLREPFALSSSMDGNWLALLDSPFEDTRLALSLQSVLVWNLPETGAIRRITDVDSGSLAADVDLSPDGAFMAITGDGSQLIRTFNWLVVWQHPPPPDVPASGTWTRNFAFSPDGRTLASARSFQVDLFRTEDGALLTSLVSKASSPGIAVSPDGRFLVSSAPNLWRLQDRTSVWDYSVDEPAVPPTGLTDHWASYSPDGTLILLQYAHRPVGATGVMYQTQTQLTNAATGALVQDLGTTLPRRPTFSPDGRWVLAGDRLLNLQTGAITSLGFPATISHFLADGRIFAAGVAGNRLLCPQ